MAIPATTDREVQTDSHQLQEVAPSAELFIQLCKQEGIQIMEGVPSEQLLQMFQITMTMMNLAMQDPTVRNRMISGSEAKTHDTSPPIEEKDHLSADRPPSPIASTVTKMPPLQIETQRVGSAFREWNRRADALADREVQEIFRPMTGSFLNEVGDEEKKADALSQPLSPYLEQRAWGHFRPSYAFL